MKSYVYPAATSTARALIRYIIDMMNREPERIFYLAFSGGTTPSLMFDIWAHEFREETPWMRMRIFWVDERCVSVSDSDSNYGTMLRLLLQEVGMPDEYVYPIHGDCRSPAQEAKRYSDLVSSTVPLRRGFPTFDIVLLGAGDDGHTSSIFPGQEYLLSSFHPYEKSHSTAKDACQTAEKLGVKNLVLYHTEDKNLARRRELYTCLLYTSPSPRDTR